MAARSMPDLRGRLLTALPIAFFYAFSCMYNGHWHLLLLVALLAFNFIALRDFYHLCTRSAAERPFTGVGYAFAAFIILPFWNVALRSAPDYTALPLWVRSTSDKLQPDSALIILLILAMTAGSLGWALFRKKHEGAIYSSATTIFGILYVVLPICHAPLMINLRDGIFWAWLVSWCTFMSDTAAYLAGRLWGRHPAGIFVSPNKTIEGYLGGALLSVALAFAFYLPVQKVFLVPALTWYQLSAIAAVIYAASVFGDLIESLIKRDNRNKNAGSYLPGHGGLLDIIDSFLVVFPASFYIIRYFQ